MAGSWRLRKGLGFSDKVVYLLDEAILDLYHKHRVELLPAREPCNGPGNMLNQNAKTISDDSRSGTNLQPQAVFLRFNFSHT